MSASVVIAGPADAPRGPAPPTAPPGGGDLFAMLLNLVGGQDAPDGASGPAAPPRRPAKSQAEDDKPDAGAGDPTAATTEKRAVADATDAEDTGDGQAAIGVLALLIPAPASPASPPASGAYALPTTGSAAPPASPPLSGPPVPALPFAAPTAAQTLATGAPQAASTPPVPAEPKAASPIELASFPLADPASPPILSGQASRPPAIIGSDPAALAPPAQADAAPRSITQATRPTTANLSAPTQPTSPTGPTTPTLATASTAPEPSAPPGPAAEAAVSVPVEAAVAPPPVPAAKTTPAVKAGAAKPSAAAGASPAAEAQSPAAEASAPPAGRPGAAETNDQPAEFTLAEAETPQEGDLAPGPAAGPDNTAPTSGQATPAAAAPLQGAPQATPATAAHLAAQILRRMDGRISRFDVQLDPDGLGQVRVAVEIDTRGRLSAALAFDRPESATALRAQAGVLQAALERAGFDLSGGGLSFDTAEGGDRAAQDQSQDSPARRERAFDASTEAAVQTDRTAGTRLGAALRGLDIRI